MARQLVVPSVVIGCVLAGVTSGAQNFIVGQPTLLTSSPTAQLRGSPGAEASRPEAETFAALGAVGLVAGAVATGAAKSRTQRRHCRPQLRATKTGAEEVLEVAAVVGEKVSAVAVKQLRERSRAAVLDCQKALSECGGDQEKAMEWLKKRGIAKADKKAGNVAVEGCIASYVHFNNKIAVLVEVNSETDFVAQNAIFKEFASDVAMQIAAMPSVVAVSSDEVPSEVKAKEKEIEMQKDDLAGKPDNMKEKIVDGRLKKRWDEMSLLSQKWLKDEERTVQDILKQTIAKIGENIVIRRFSRITLGEGLVKKDTDFAAGVEKELAKYNTAAEEAAKESKPKEAKEEKPKAEKDIAVSAKDVKLLRDRSGAGVLESQKALKESAGDIDKAMEWLRKRGIAKADKKAGNVSAEGSIASYVHFNNKIGVIVEVNSETDFVAINEIFKNFAADVAMQIAANPTVVCVTADEVPAELKAKEKAIEMEKDDLAGKPAEMKEKIVEGRLKKRWDEMALLSQTWLKDDSKTVKDVLKETIAKLGENIVIRRFSKVTLGEGLAKKDGDFAAGVEQELAKYRAAA